MLPRPIFDYVDGGAESEFTVRENRRAFEQVTLRPKGAVDWEGTDLRVSVLGAGLSMPVVLAPCGAARVVHPGGDVAGVQAAKDVGIPFVLSTMSAHSIEEVAAAAGDATLWYQVYRVGPRERVEHAIERAKKSGVSALVITIDTAVSSLRERDRRSGGLQLLSASMLETLPYLPRLMGHPRWLAQHLFDEVRPRLRNVVQEDGSFEILGRHSPTHSLTWEDLRWVREIWGGPIIIKGLVTSEDAVRAIDEGAAAVVVSNHGGRQLDYADATLRVLPEIVNAINGRCEVLLDGGIRRGTDVLKAIALGAQAVLIGRAWMWGLGVAGQDGIDQVLSILREGMTRNMALLGCKKISELDRSFVRAPAEWLET